MMGPLSVTTPSKKLSLLVFTAIDPATGWFECIEVPNKQSFTVMEAFNNHWLSRYPRPQQRIRFDNGTEFKSVFREICSNYAGLKAKPTTTYNPRSNGIIERVHQTLRDNLATFELLSNRELPEYDPFGSFLSAAAWAIDLEVLFILLSKLLQVSWYLEEICY
jgi:transposase InsO family protein